MQVEVQAVEPQQVEADVVAVPLAAGNGLDGVAARVDAAVDGLLGRLAGDGELHDEVGRAGLVHVDGTLSARRVAAAGIGPRDQVDSDALRSAAAAVARLAGEFAERIAWAIDSSLPLSALEQARAIVDGTVLGSYEPARWKHEEPTSKLSALVLCGEADGLAEAAERAATVA